MNLNRSWQVMRWCPEASWSIWRLNSRQRKPQFRGGSLALYFEKNSLLSCIQWEHFGNTVIPGLIHLNARVQKTSSGVSVSFTGWFMMRTVSCGAGARAWALWAQTSGTWREITSSNKDEDTDPRLPDLYRFCVIHGLSRWGVYFTNVQMRWAGLG